MSLPPMTRRAALAGAAATGFVPAVAAGTARPGQRGAADSPQLRVAARSDRLCNGVAVSQQGFIFLGLPRLNGHAETPGLVRLEEDGATTPFPGGRWNEWRPGVDPREAFVNVNAVHVFADDTLWVVDQGTTASGPVAGGAKIVRIDAATGTVLTVLRFADAILPPGAAMNDLRVHDNIVYVTDSGRGGIIVHDLAADRTVRRLSGHPLTRKPEAQVQRGAGGRVLADRAGRRPAVHSDMIELDADGAWLYWSTPTGPIRRIATELLLDERLDDDALAQAVQTIAEIPTIGGTAMDTLGNLYLSDAESRRITILTPQGRQVPLIADDRLSSPDAIFIDHRRRLFVPASQLEDLAVHAGADRTRPPWQVFVMDLPEEVDGVRLGDAVTGRPPDRGLGFIRGIEHVAMTVPDMEDGIRFLEQAFGATVLYRHLKLTDEPLKGPGVAKMNALPAGATMRGLCQLRLGNAANIELFQIDGVRRTQAAQINDMGLVHFSVAVDDIDAACARFERAGGKLLPGPHDLGTNEKGPGNRFRFGQTPWGTWIEFATLRSPLRYDAGARQQRWIPQRG